MRYLDFDGEDVEFNNFNLPIRPDYKNISTNTKLAPKYIERKNEYQKIEEIVPLNVENVSIAKNWSDVAKMPTSKPKSESIKDNTSVKSNKKIFMILGGIALIGISIFAYRKFKK